MRFYVEVPYAYAEGWRALLEHEHRTPREQTEYLIVQAVRAYQDAQDAQRRAPLAVPIEVVYG